MKNSIRLFSAVIFLLSSSLSLTAPTVYPTGNTIYDPTNTWNGFNVLSILDSPNVIVIDMNGNAVKEWEGFNLSPGGPARVLPGGNVIGTTGSNTPHQEALALIQQNFEGIETWRYEKNLQITQSNGESVWSARIHHDWQRTDIPAGYYSPGSDPQLDNGRTLLLTHTNHVDENISTVMLEDDRLIEIDQAGNILWEWLAADHIDEFSFDTEERAAIATASRFNEARGSFDWFHINSATYVGPNQWYDAGDSRFHPDNVIISSREASVIAIIDRNGSVVWQIGPDFSRSEEEMAIGQVIGQHNAHFIPQGLPGAGNIIIFDNGGSSGYGAPSPIAQMGTGIYARATSRILEINPVTLELVWSYARANFFSTNISGAQRLPNGNTLITEGAPGRVFEITPDGDIVWEYMNPPSPFSTRGSNAVYRAYRIPYSWIPQLDTPVERVVVTPELGDFVLP
ncbi:MAG: aryl-sulfate sulfotransferase [Gammaproteobacteria bacterium]|nr:aryl-sulfate sulfotransferase [Gammaproteobacteria bacterium]